MRKQAYEARMLFSNKQKIRLVLYKQKKTSEKKIRGFLKKKKLKKKNKKPIKIQKTKKRTGKTFLTKKRKDMMSFLLDSCNY